MSIIKRLIFIFLLCFFTSTHVFSKPTESTDYLDSPENTGIDVSVSTDIEVPASTEINSPEPALENPVKPSKVKEERDLLIYKRGIMPYYKQPFYDIYLENYSNTQSNKYPIQLARHHIIPHNVFVSFFNTLVRNNALDICSVLFDTVGDNVPYYDITYIATSSEDSARFACYNLSEVAGYTEIYPLNSEAWELVNNKYNIIHK